MDIKEKIHELSEEMIQNLGRLVAVDSQLGTPEEGKPFGEGPAKALEVGLKIADELGFQTVNLDNYCGYAEMGEGKEIIGIGYKLLAASFASQLIIGIVRFAIEQKWGTIVFGKVSLTLSLSNMVITCIGAVSVVLFPMLKKMKEETLEELFLTMRTVLTVPVLAVLIFYTPMRWILELWLPQYHDSLHYLAVLFPICVYETRSVALIDTYLKAYRKEKLILFNSLVTVGISALLSWITVFLMGSLDAAVISIVLLMMFKNIFSEKMLLRSSLPVKVWKDNILEVALTGIFILVNWKIGGITAMLLYTAAYIIYVLLKSKDIKREMKNLKKIARG